MSDQPFQQQDSSQSTRDVAVEETKSVGQDAKEGALAFRENYNWFVTPFFNGAAMLNVGARATQLPITRVTNGGAAYPSWTRNGERLTLTMTGDETCIPAIAHILETMPASTKAFVFIEVDNRNGEIELQTQADAVIRWVHRNGAPAGPGDLMNGMVQGFALPSGKGHAYIIGETSNVRRQRQRFEMRAIPTIAEPIARRVPAGMLASLMSIST